VGSRMKYSNNSSKQGQIRKRRRKRAERREATAEARQAINDKMRAAEHPGWVERERPVPRWLTQRLSRDA